MSNYTYREQKASHMKKDEKQKESSQQCQNPTMANINDMS